MDALCNGCGGRVMPYREYFAQFRSTAVCETCGARVRLRRYAALMTVFALGAGAYAAILYFTHSIPLIAIGVLLGSLLAILADFWTYRNLTWDCVDEPRQPGPTHAR